MSKKRGTSLGLQRQRKPVGIRKDMDQETALTQNSGSLSERKAESDFHESFHCFCRCLLVPTIRQAPAEAGSARSRDDMV